LAILKFGNDKSCVPEITILILLEDTMLQFLYHMLVCRYINMTVSKGGSVFWRMCK